MLRGLKDSGYAVPVITSNSNMTYAQMIAYQSVLPATFYFVFRTRNAARTNAAGTAARRPGPVYVNAFRKLHIRPGHRS